MKQEDYTFYSYYQFPANFPFFAVNNLNHVFAFNRKGILRNNGWGDSGFDMFKNINGYYKYGTLKDTLNLTILPEYHHLVLSALEITLEPIVLTDIKTKDIIDKLNRSRAFNGDSVLRLDNVESEYASELFKIGKIESYKGKFFINKIDKQLHLY